MNWNIETLALYVPIAAIVLGGVGYLGRRWITGQAHIEDQESLERAIRLQRLLNEEGISLDEAKSLRDQFRQSRGGFTQAEANAIAAKVAEAEEREKETVGLDAPNKTPFEETTIGMGIRARAELDILEESLACAVEQLREDCTENRKNSLDEAQKAWSKFRDADAKLASLLAEGGTLAPLLYTGHQIYLTEQRIKEIRLMKAETNL